MKTYPLEVVSMDDLGYFSKGHQDKQDFIEAVNKLDLELGGDGDFDTAHINYNWWRSKPCGKSCFDVCYAICDGPGPGAFPVTVAYI